MDYAKENWRKGMSGDRLDDIAGYEDGWNDAIEEAAKLFTVDNSPVLVKEIEIKQVVSSLLKLKRKD